MKKAMLVLLVGILLAGCASAPVPITHVVAFGGEFSDNGNYFRLAKEGVAKGQMPTSMLSFTQINWQGRLTNGPVAVEILADRLKVDLTDYAVAAATSGQGNFNSMYAVLENTGLLGQIDQFEAELNGKRGEASTLYYLESGFVDFTASMISDRKLSDPAVADINNQEIANLTTAITRLAKLGGRQFLVVSPDWSKWPGFAIGAPFFDANPVDQAIVERSTRFLNLKKSSLPGAMEKLASQLNINIRLFDLAAAEGPIHSNPAQYGFTDLAEPCTSLPFGGSGCAYPEKYYYWGYYYLSARAHQVLGEAMVSQLTK